MSAMYCTQCKIEAKATAKFCPRCGGQLVPQADPEIQALQCPQCGKIYGADHQFCADDGLQLQPRGTSGSSSTKPSPTAAPTPVLKIVLLIFALLLFAALGTGGYLYFSGRWVDIPVLAKWFTPPTTPMISDDVNKGYPAIEGTTWVVYFDVLRSGRCGIYGKPDWTKHTTIRFLRNGKLLTEDDNGEDSSWKLVGNKLTGSAKYLYNMELTLKGNQMAGTGEVGMSNLVVNCLRLVRQ